MLDVELYNEKYWKGEYIHCVVRRISSGPDTEQENPVAEFCVQVEWASRGSEGPTHTHPFLSRARHHGRLLSSRIKYSSPFLNCKSFAFIGI